MPPFGSCSLTLNVGNEFHEENVIVVRREVEESEIAMEGYEVFHNLDSQGRETPQWENWTYTHQPTMKSC